MGRPEENEMAQLNGYVAGLKGARIEIYAESLYAAKVKAIEELKPKKKDMGLLWVMLAEKAGEPVIHAAID